MRQDEAATLVERRTLSSDAFLLDFESPSLPRALTPGQFTMVRVRHPHLLLRRPYSFCGVDLAQGRFSLLVKVVGEGTRALAELPLGDTVDCLGPLGTSFRLPRAGARPLMVAGGVGIAPFLGFCQTLADRGLRGEIVLGGRRAEDLYLKADFERLGITVRAATEDGSVGQRGLVTDLLAERLEEDPGPYEIYSCGPTGMLQRVAQIARERRIPHQVSIERRMGCGMGCCLGCVVFTEREGETRGEYRRTCTEGPVFDAEEIRWERDPRPM